MEHVKETQASNPETLCPGDLLKVGSGRVEQWPRDTEWCWGTPPPNPVWPLPEAWAYGQGAWIPNRAAGSGHRPQAPDSERHGPWRLEQLLSACASHLERKSLVGWKVKSKEKTKIHEPMITPEELKHGNPHLSPVGQL